MAGLFKRLFKFGKRDDAAAPAEAGPQGRHEEERVEGSTSDVEVSVTGAPDADFHRQAQATPVADEEAGADLEDDSAAIETVKDTPPPPADPDQDAAAERAKREAEQRRASGEAQKKTTR